MALIVEDGTQVTEANTYVSLLDFVTYAEQIGIAVADDESTEAILVQAAEFIDSHEPKLKGTRVSRDQAMAFPREGVKIDGWTWGSTEIPRNVILCQMAVALDINAGVDPYNPPQNKVRTAERVEGAVSVSYAVGQGHKLTRASKADALLRSLLRQSGLRVVR